MCKGYSAEVSHDVQIRHAARMTSCFLPIRAKLGSTRHMPTNADSQMTEWGRVLGHLTCLTCVREGGGQNSGNAAPRLVSLELKLIIVLFFCQLGEGDEGETRGRSDDARFEFVGANGARPFGPLVELARTPLVPRQASPAPPDALSLLTEQVRAAYRKSGRNGVAFVLFCSCTECWPRADCTPSGNGEDRGCGGGTK